MKKLISILMLLMAFTMSSNAMSYEQARQQALFLTDKMAYELNLTNDQYEAAYEINLDYLMSVNTVDDLYGAYWRYRNLDMSYILLDWQYRAFCDAAYFYRPLYFNAGYWHFGIYARYPHRDYFYFDRPTVYISYCGGHSWGMNRGRSWYHGRSYGPRRGDNHFGMRDGFDRGDYGRGNRQSFGSREPQYISGRPQSSFGGQSNRQQGSFGSRGSSTRTTVKRSLTDNNTNREQFGSSREQFVQVVDSLDRAVEATTYTTHHATRSHAPTLRASPISQDRRSATAAATTARRSEAVRALTTTRRSAHAARSVVHATTEAHRSVAALALTVEAETAMAAVATAHSEAVANITLSYTAQQQNI